MMAQATLNEKLEKSSTSGEDPIQPAAASPAPVDFSAMLATLKRSRKTISGIAGVIFLATTVAAFLMPTEYSSVASFVPPTSSASSAMAALASQVSSAGGAAGMLSGSKGPGDLYAGILRSRSIADKLITRFDLKKVYRVKHDSDAVKRLASNTTITVGPKDTIIALTVQDRSPERARDLANAYLDALRDANGRLALTESSQRRLFFDQQLAQEKNALEDAEVELKKIEEESGLIAPTGQTALQIQTIEKIRAEISARRIELASMRQSSTDQNPAVVRLSSMISELERQLANLQHGSKGGDSGAIPVSKTPELQLMYVRRAREVKYHEALFELIGKQDEMAHMDEARDAPMLQVLDSASYPDVKSWPPRALFMMGGLFVGLLSGCLFVLGREYVQKS
ncbi:GumC family protein [Terriglobus sp. RCC_193]|uniref:GumC family protein n=1 Tax=Terriglobus sp. RCC_193 TaxID=3239218 RepID=UPI0035232F7C